MAPVDLNLDINPFCAILKYKIKVIRQLEWFAPSSFYFGAGYSLWKSFFKLGVCVCVYQHALCIFKKAMQRMIQTLGSVLDQENGQCYAC